MTPCGLEIAQEGVLSTIEDLTIEDVTLERREDVTLEKRTDIVFRRLDIHGDGLINRGVFENSLRQLDPETWDDRRLVRRLLRAIDTNGDGIIQPEELRAWLANEGDPWDEARESVAFSIEEPVRGEDTDVPTCECDGQIIFRRLDLKSDGVIDFEEFIEALRRLDEDNWEDSHRIRRLFKAIDTNCDGLLSWEEFDTWLRSSGDKWDEARESAAFAQHVAETTEASTEDARIRAIEVFERLDMNCDGVVDKEEFAKSLLEYDEDNWNARTIKRLFKAIDANNQGCIQLREIAAWLEMSGDQWDAARSSPVFSLQGASPAPAQQNVYNTRGSPTDFYEIDGQRIGEGSFGSVFKCTHRVTQMVRAVKTIPRAKMETEDLESEISIMTGLDHPHILRIYEVFEDPLNTYMVMELCMGGELFDRVVEAASFTERQGAAVMRQITSGVRYMHENYVCHRDLKPENFLLRDRGPIEDCIVKIIDFGIACRFTPAEPMTQRQGTLYYIAPEVLTGSYDQLCDVWSCGVSLYILLSGYPPFNGSNDEEILDCVRSGSFQFHKDHWSSISADAKDLIRWMLQFDPRHRCTAKQVLEHVWVKDQAPASSNISLQAGQLTNMRAFCSQNRLKKAALQIIAKELQEDQIQQLKDVFVSLDLNGDGKVTFQELEEGIARLEMPETLQSIMEVAHQVDVNNSGSIEYSEFLAAALDKRHYEEEKVCWAAFHNFDRDGNGTICHAELQQVLEDGSVEAMMGPDCVHRILTECDADSDGVISFEEFMLMMRSHA